MTLGVPSFDEAPGRSNPIFTSLTPTSASESYATGKVPGPGTYFCVDCGSQLSLEENERLPECPSCGASVFRRDSIFEQMQDHGQATTAEFPAAVEIEPPNWLAEAREMLPGAGRYLACREEDGEIRVFPIGQGWTRVGRSATADIRLDDPTVSRRHALLVSEPDESLRILDDRSLNGIFVNGEIVDWAKIEDGDELTVGRYHLFALEA